MPEIFSILYPTWFDICDGCRAVTQKAQKAVDAAIENRYALPSSGHNYVQTFCNNDRDRKLQAPTTSPVSMRAQFDAISPLNQRVVFCAPTIQINCPALPPSTESLPDLID